MSIVPLPVFEADADPSRRDAMTDAEILARLRPPTSIVVKFGSMRLVGEFPYDGDAKPGCGSKLVIRTVRGTEMAEMLTTTCSNSGCGKSISRKQMLEYIEASGGKDYPFQEHGRILRVATIEDMNRWSAIQAEKPSMLRRAREIAAAAGMTIKLVDIEQILGGETTLIYYLSEERIDFRDVVKDFANEFGSRIDMRQVGARDEARLVADYERCGQHCCCKNFLKVLKPVSMRSAKVQKATLDPLKISGRCGRLMCCLRYEDETYTELKARLPKLKTRVGTSEGPGIVMETKILVQLALVRLEHDGREIAVPIEELMDPEHCPPPGSNASADMESDPLRGADPRAVRDRTRGRRGAEGRSTPTAPKEPGRPAREQPRDRPPAPKREAPRPPRETAPSDKGASSGESAGAGDRVRKGDSVRTGDRPSSGSGAGPGKGDSTGGTEAPRKKRRRRRRKAGGEERSTQDQQDAFRAMSEAEDRVGAPPPQTSPDSPTASKGPDSKGPDSSGDDSDGEVSGASDSPDAAGSKRKRRRRRRRKGGGEQA